MPTQDELIARALDNEEGNIVEHRDYLKLEEEKRKRARVVRAVINGPLLRWISKVEEVKVPVDPPMPPPPPPPPPPYGYAYNVASGYQASGANTSAPYSLVTSVPYYQNASPVPPQPAHPSTPAAPVTSQQPASYTPIPPPIPPIPSPMERTEKIAKNYLVHELGQFESVPKPPWKDTMEAMFGDHVEWEDLRVFVGKGRPLGSFHLPLYGEF